MDQRPTEQDPGQIGLLDASHHWRNPEQPNVFLNCREECIRSCQRNALEGLTSGTHRLWQIGLVERVVDQFSQPVASSLMESSQAPRSGSQIFEKCDVRADRAAR
jgi:hypothetical protein